MALYKNFNLPFFWLFIHIIWLYIKKIVWQLCLRKPLKTETESRQRASCRRPVNSQRHYSLSTPGFTNSTFLSKATSLAHIKDIPLTSPVSAIQIIYINNFCLFLSLHRRYLLHLFFRAASRVFITFATIQTVTLQSFQIYAV